MLKEMVQAQTEGLVKINNYGLQIKEFNGQRVVTFKEIDMIHERVEGTAKRNFNTNSKHFIEKTDFYFVKPADVKEYEIRTSEINNAGTYLITESGYLMLVKSLQDDLAWKVQRELVNNYFRVRENPFESLSPELQSIFMLDKKQHQIEVKVKKVETKVDDFIGSSPLFNVECDELIKTVNSKVKELIGYRTPAYNNRSLRGKIYSDIHYQIRREFGVKSYKAIRRVDLNIAKSIVANYGVPLVLQNEITKINNQIKFSEVV